jgi:DNA-binding Lrp family transcriptional regulator
MGESTKNMTNSLPHAYDDLFVDCDDPEVGKLYHLLRLFFAKCDGLIASADVRRLTAEVNGIPFDPYETPTYRRDQILERLKFLKRYRINSPREIVRILTWGLFATDSIKRSDRKYLVAFVENAGKPLTRIASALTVSPGSAYEAYRRLRRRIQLRYVAFMNYPLFKLRHYILFFKPDEDFDVSTLLREFTLTVNRDVYTDWAWATFLVPDQERTLKEFTNGLRSLSHSAFAEYSLHGVTSYGKSYNLSLFDGQKWVCAEEALAVGALRFSEQTTDDMVGEPPFFDLTYASEPTKFDDVDFILAFLKFGNARMRNAEMRSVLRSYGHNLSWGVVSHRVSRLLGLNAFMPVPNFSGLGLTVASTYAVECDDIVTRALRRALPHFPECAAMCRTDKGIVFMVRAPPDAMPTIAYMIDGALRDRAERVILAIRLENMGTKNPISLHSHWNADRQYWVFDRGFFDLSREYK